MPGSYWCPSCNQWLKKTQYFHHQNYGCSCENGETQALGDLGPQKLIYTPETCPGPMELLYDPEVIRIPKNNQVDLNHHMTVDHAIDVPATGNDIEPTTIHVLPGHAELDYFSSETESEDGSDLEQAPAMPAEQPARVAPMDRTEGTSDDETVDLDEEDSDSGGEDDCSNPNVPNSYFTTGRNPINLMKDSLVWAIVLFVLLWQKMFKVSDRAIEILLSFLGNVIFAIGKLFSLPELNHFHIPSTIFKAKQYLNIKGNAFQQIAVCPTCDTLYDISDCIRMKQGQDISRKCEHFQFPNHPHRHMRQACGTPLLKKVIQNGQTKWVPKKIYCYNPLENAIEQIVSRKNFITDCNEWRKRQVANDTLEDIYDGKVWKDAQQSGYFDSWYNLSFTLNVDWFQPYKHQQHSVGAIYLVFNNLPRHKRYLPDNVILVGVIPGPDETKGNINSYLQPLVDELLNFWEGVTLFDNSPLGQNVYRAALHCVSSDVPAIRKVGGFVGHGAVKGCSKCLRSFITVKFGEKADYSGYDVDDCSPLRTDEDHIAWAQTAANLKSLAERKRHERLYGARWSELFRLPYFRPVTFHCIDPMHNLLLGTAKRVVKVWEAAGILDSDSMKTIQARVNKMKVPSDLGRIPGKMSSGFSGLTADQWKNWTTIFSLFCLKDVIPDADFRCWALFVHACRTLCSRRITLSQLNEGHTYLVTFCKTFVNMYGKNNATINMHLHMHLKECILNYGPVYSFWCFSFERYNGILGSIKNNHQNIEVQIMRKFVFGIEMAGLTFPVQYKIFGDILNSKSIELRGTLKEGLLFVSDFSRRLRIAQADCVHDLSFVHEDLTTTLCGKPKNKVLEPDEIDDLNDMFQALYPGIRFDIVKFYTEYPKVQLFGETYAKESSINDRSACILAKWWDGNQICPSNTPTPGIIKSLCLVQCILHFREGTKKYTFSLAKVIWYTRNHRQGYYGFSAQVWGPDTYGGSYLPVQRLLCRCAQVETKLLLEGARHGKEKVVVIVPLVNRQSH